MYINHQYLQSGWCVYSITKAGESAPDFVWISKLSNVSTVTDALKNPDFDKRANYWLQVISYHPNKLAALNAQGAWMKEHGTPIMNKTQHINRRNPVQCEQTGQIWQNARECATALGINQSQLSQHLRRNPGYKSVKGLTFINVSSKPQAVAPQAVQYP